MFLVRISLEKVGFGKEKANPRSIEPTGLNLTYRYFHFHPLKWLRSTI